MMESPMNIALIGATGFVGKALLEELLSRGHQVRALQRDATKLAARPGLEVRSVDVLATPKLAAELQGVDAVVSAFNAGWGNPNLHDDFLRGSDAIAAATRDAESVSKGQVRRREGCQQRGAGGQRQGEEEPAARRQLLHGSVSVGFDAALVAGRLLRPIDCMTRPPFPIRESAQTLGKCRHH